MGRMRPGRNTREFADQIFALAQNLVWCRRFLRDEHLYKPRVEGLPAELVEFQIYAHKRALQKAEEGLKRGIPTSMSLSIGPPYSFSGNPPGADFYFIYMTRPEGQGAW